MHFRRKSRISYARVPVQVYILAENYRINPPIMNEIIAHVSILNLNGIPSTNPSIRIPGVLCTFSQLPVTVSITSAVELKSLCVAISVCGSSQELRHCTSSVLGLLRATTDTRPTASVRSRLNVDFRFSYFRFRFPATSSADTFCTNGH